MQQQFDNLVLASFNLWLDHTIINKGQAYTNVTGRFYNITSPYQGIYTYALPYKQVIADSSITGANILSGVYINGVFTTTGQSNLVSFNYDHGHVYFSSGVNNVISGYYAIKDFNIYITEQPEEKLLFETKHTVRPKVTRTETGLAANTYTYPAIYLKLNGGNNEPFEFGGTDTTIIPIRAIVLSDTQFNLDAVCSILRDTVRTNIPLFAAGDMPYNIYGGLNNANYNYDTLLTNRTNPSNWLFVDKVFVSKLSKVYTTLPEYSNPNLFTAFIDFEISSVRNPHI